MVTMTTGFQLNGVLSQDGMEIAWSNGAFWTRLSECGTYGHERLPLHIPNGFQIGSQILCTGVWARERAGEDGSGPEIWALNLVTSDGDIALHVNPRDCEEARSGCNANEHHVVRNSFLAGSWGTEERDGDLPLVSFSLLSSPWSVSSGLRFHLRAACARCLQRHDVPFQLRITAGQNDFRITFEGDGSRGEFGVYDGYTIVPFVIRLGSLSGTNEP
jgi:hypothetical protein